MSLAVRRKVSLPAFVHSEFGMNFEQQQAIERVEKYCEGRVSVKRVPLADGGYLLLLQSPIYQHLWDVLWDLWVDEIAVYPPIGEHSSIEKIKLPIFVKVGNQAMQHCYYRTRIIFPPPQIDIPNFDVYDPYQNDGDGGLL